MKLDKSFARNVVNIKKLPFLMHRQMMSVMVVVMVTSPNQFLDYQSMDFNIRTMKTAEDIRDKVLAYQPEMQPMITPKQARKRQAEFIESYAKETSMNAICDYLMDKSDKAHINTVEDWVNDWYEEQINQ